MIIKKLAKGLWSALNVFRALVQNLFFIFTVLVFVLIFIQVSNNLNKSPKIPESGALVLNLNGKIVEQKQTLSLMEQLNRNLSGADKNVEIELSELLHAINTATNDKKVTALVLELENLQTSSLSKLQEIGAAIKRFKSSNKPVIAMADNYSQEQYYLASYADNVYLNPAGQVLVYGYGRYQLYLKSAIEKLMITPHVFRVGSYKSAVEPFIRDDMSPEARADAQRWLDLLWQSYVDDVSQLRGLTKDKIAPSLEQFQQRFKEAKGNLANYALQVGLVDELKTRPELLTIMQSLAGKDEDETGFQQIQYSDYIRVINEPYSQEIGKGYTHNNIALITASGTILNGEQPAGSIGGDTLSAQLLNIRLDDTVKALVLRIDSPGGSAFASEIIRNELQAISRNGTPIIVSMGSVAASGGYWIAAGADKIFATKNTITGSIGIFGMFATFENALTNLGINADGIKTGPFAGIGITKALPDYIAETIQLGIENGYQNFIQLVANGRGMDTTRVNEIAQGRIWTGSEAKEIGLVDEIGDLSDAIKAAAELANLTDYQVKVIKEKLSPQEQLMTTLFSAAIDFNLKTDNPLTILFRGLQQKVSWLEQFNDPQGKYVFCPVCQE